MRLTASDAYTYYRPSRCGLRVILKHWGKEETPPGPYEQVIERLGQRHEKAHLATFPSYVDLSPGTLEQRASRTKEEVASRAGVIYQGVLRAAATIGGVDCEVLGIPDFLILGGAADYVIRDSKLSRRIAESDHPEILRQLGIYGWLYERTSGRAPAGLQIHSGTGDIVEAPHDGGVAALELLQEILRLKQSVSEPYTPVGWSKCGGCGFYDYCWKKAEASRDPALVPGVDQGLASALHDRGIETFGQLLDSFDERRLAGFQRPWGNRTQRVGKKAGAILQMARAIMTGQEILIQPPDIPDYPNYVMFDLEGIPPQFDEAERIYLWGVQVFGQRPSESLVALAGFGPDGDRQGWEDFLEIAEGIFAEHEDIPFVHWHHYEKTNLDKYVERFGDRDGVAARVRQNLLDLLPITQRSIALPLPSYSLKVVEGHIGFKRSQREYGGDWAMAMFIEATETADKEKRVELMDRILRYNREDLEATWAVLEWLRSRCT